MRLFNWVDLKCLDTRDLVDYPTQLYICTWIFHDKAKRTHQGNLLPFDVVEEPPPVLLPVCVQCIVSGTKRVLFKTRKPLCNIVIELELCSFLDHLFHPWQASDLLSLVFLSRPAS